MFIPAIGLFVALIFLPLYLIYSLGATVEPSKYDWVLKVVDRALLLVILFLIGRWDWFSIYLIYLYFLLFNSAAILSFRRVHRLPIFVGEGRQKWMKNPMVIVEIVIGIAALIFILSAHLRSEDGVELEFPLQDGTYYIAHGGSNIALNNHSPNESQHYALDIVELNTFGMRAAGIYPKDLDRYVIFDETIHSPCDGSISEVVDGLPDNIPPKSDRDNPAGNYVVVDCQDVRVVLAHMRNGSVLVEVDDAVTTGQPLGSVGNSGNTSEPHLHIHAVEGDAADVLDGDAVPIIFDDDFPVRNNTIVR